MAARLGGVQPPEGEIVRRDFIHVLFYKVGRVCQTPDRKDPGMNIVRYTSTSTVR
jgi:hypothetical protein